MKKFGEIVREMYEDGKAKKRYSQRGFSKRAGIATPTLWRLFSRDSIDGIHSGTIESLAGALGMTVENFMSEVRARQSGKPPLLPGNFTIPLVSRGSAGNAREYEVDLMNTEGVPGQLYPYPARDPLAVRIDGHSMSWEGKQSLEDGDVVIFCNEFDEVIPDNSLVVARLMDDDSLLVKRVRFISSDKIELHSQNMRFDPIPLERNRVILRRVKVAVSRFYTGHNQG